MPPEWARTFDIYDETCAENRGRICDLEIFGMTLPQRSYCGIVFVHCLSHAQLSSEKEMQARAEFKEPTNLTARTRVSHAEEHLAGNVHLDVL